jgi:tripartite ATP-independent transporter DctM subunit
MSVTAIAGLILVLGIAVTLALGCPISVGVGCSSFAALIVIMGYDKAVLTAAQQVFKGINSFSLLAIPFFILAGVIMNNGGIAVRLVDAAKVLVGRAPGSLAQANIAANAMFGAVSGSGVAAAAAMGSTIAPLEEKEGYDRRFAAAANIASGPSGMIIPPSNLMIVYSLVSSASVAALFVAGYLPGFLWMAACMVIVYLYARKKPELKVTTHLGVRRSLVVVAKAVPAIFMIVVVIGGILAGFFTATEASCIAVVYSLVLSFIYRSIGLRDIPRLLLEATRTTAAVVFLIGVSTIMGFVLAYSGIPALVAHGLMSVSTNPVVILLLIAVILLVIGCFMDPTPAVLIFTPIFLPIVTDMGISPIHFGIMMVFNLSIGTITPPVGPILFVGAKVGKVRIEEVTRFLLPFFAVLVVCLLVVMFTPGLSLWLPGLLGLI